MRPTLPPSAALDSGPLCARLDQAPYTPPLRGPPCGGLPPLPRGATLHRRVNAPLRWPHAAGAARVMAAPASAPAPPLARRGAAYAGAGPSSPRRHAFGVHGWAAGGLASRHTSWPGRARQRSAGFFAALCRALAPASGGLRVGARAVILTNFRLKNFARQNPATPQDFHTMGNILE